MVKCRKIYVAVPSNWDNGWAGNMLMRVILKVPGFIILLCNKFPPHLVTLNNMHLLCYNLCGLWIWAQLTWVLCFGVSHGAVIKVPARAGTDHTQGEGIMQKCEYWEAGITGSCARSRLSQTPRNCNTLSSPSFLFGFLLLFSKWQADSLPD